MKELYVSNYNLESIYDYIVLESSYKEINISNFSIEVIHSYIEPSTIGTNYGFFGEVFENTTKVERELFAFSQNNLYLTSYSTSVSGTFSLQHNLQETYFLVCKDDVSGESYNNLVIASMVPKLLNTYGLVEDNPGLSAYDIKINNSVATYNGLYWIKPVGYTSAVQVFCDMITQGGGWTMCVRWDRDFISGSYYLPVNALRSNININDMIYTNTLCASQVSTINIIPLISAGANMFMHVSLEVGDTVWKHIYFSEIYQAVLDNPSNIFDSYYDTNTGTSLGSIVRSSPILRNRWFDYSMSHPIPSTTLEYVQDYYLNGGPGTAMFTVNTDTGASYSSHNNTSCTAAYNPIVFWGFVGKDSSLPTNNNPTKQLVGTYSSAASPPNSRFNLMFIR